jgi:hypothetical protein
VIVVAGEVIVVIGRGEGREPGREREEAELHLCTVGI